MNDYSYKRGVVFGLEAFNSEIGGRGVVQNIHEIKIQIKKDVVDVFISKL